MARTVIMQVRDVERERERRDVIQSSKWPEGMRLGQFGSDCAAS